MTPAAMKQRLAPSLWVTLLLLAAFRMAALLVVIPPERPLTGDEPIYDQVARNILAGEGYSYHGAPWVWKPPGWPVALAGIYAIAGDSRRAVSTFQGLFDTGTALLGAWIAYRIFGTSFAALMAFATLLLWPPFFSESRFMQTEPLFTLLVTACIAAFVAFARRARPGTAFILGVLAALAALVRPTGLVPVGGLLVGWFLIERDAARRGLRHLWAAALGLVLVLAPWTIRNAVLFDGFVPISTGGGEHFYMGSIPESDGRWEPGSWYELRGRVIRKAEERLGHPLDPLEVDRALMRAGFDNWREDPLGQVGLTGMRFWRLVFLPLETDHRPWLRTGFFATLIGVYVLAIMAGFRGGRENAGARRMARMFLIALALNAAIGSLVYARSRYFEPVRPLALILAAGVLAAGIEKRTGFRGTASAD